MRWQRAALVLYGVAALLASAGPASAQPGNEQPATASVAGTVTEATSGEYVTGATVVILADTSSSARQIRGGITNKFGFYSIVRVAPGTYRLVVRGVGYAPFSKVVTLTGDAPLRLDIKLESRDVRADSIVVQAQRDPTPATALGRVDLRSDFISKLPSLGGEVDIFRALQLLPGVKSVSEISSGLYVRGGSPDQNLTLLDGVIVYNPSHLGGFMSTFNADAVRDIRLIKGAFPAEYGGRLSSVLDMTMREGTHERLSGTAGLSMINSRLTVEGPIGEDATFMLSGRRMYLDLLLLAMSEKDREVTPTYYFYDLNGKVNYRLSESDHVFLSGYFGRDVLKGPPDDDVTFDVGWGNSTANLRWAHIVSPELFTNFSAVYSDYSFSTLLAEKDSGRTRDNFKSVSGVRDYMLRGEAQYYPNDDHVVKTGLEVTEHRFRADASADIRDFGTIEQNPTILTALDASVYAQDEWRITPELSANLGARLYYFQRGNYLRLEPRLSVAYALTDAITLKGAFTTANQFLHLVTRNDITLPTDVWFPSTATVKPAEAMQGVIGVETGLFDREVVVSVEAYYKRMHNVLEYKDTTSFSLSTPLESSFTAGDGDAYGVELFVNKRVGAFTGWIGYTLAWTRRTFADLNNGKPFYPRYDRRHDVSIVLTYRLGESWELGATWVYGTGQAYSTATGRYFMQLPDMEPNSLGGNGRPFESYTDRYDYTERNGYRLPAFHKLDLNFTHSYRWFDLPWQVSINIYNAYNHRNTFAQYITQEYDEATGGYSSKLKRVTLFPIIPTFGISFKF